MNASGAVASREQAAADPRSGPLEGWTSEPPAAGASAEAIRHHYDVGDAFYRLWLDPRMVYSAARFAEGDSLERAQLRKLDHHVEAARAAGAARVLDVGCGWGALLQRLVVHHGVTCAVGLTLSDAQLTKIRADAVPGVEARLERWEEHRAERPYDAIVSIGAFEHFAHPQLGAREKREAYREFFRFCRASLRAGGRLSLQTICYGSRRCAGIDPFIAHRIFPQSELPHPSEVLEASQGLFDVVQLSNDRADYRRTCREWYGNLRRQRDAAVALIGEDKVGDYERYLRLAVAGFSTRTLGLLRVSFERSSA